MIAPLVVSTIPATDAPEVAINSNISVTFDEAIDPLSLNPSVFTVVGADGLPVAGDISCDNMIVTFNPDSDIKVNLVYTASVSVGVKDLFGNALAAPHE